MEKETKKVSDKEVKNKTSKKETKKDDKNTTSKKEVKTKKNTKKVKKQKSESFFIGVRKEMKKVRWPLKKEMVKYSIATLSFIIFFALFFTLGDLIIAGLKMLVA